jgi:hypothetical protein
LRVHASVCLYFYVLAFLSPDSPYAKLNRRLRHSYTLLGNFRPKIARYSMAP